MTTGEDEEERAWATRLARAVLAPPDEAPPDEGPRPAVVALVAVVPVAVAVPVPADEARGAGREAGEEDGPEAAATHGRGTTQQPLYVRGGVDG